MGESNEPMKSALAQASEQAMVAHTLGGRVHVRWDETAAALPRGQIVFFAEFLATAGVFERWVDACPPRYDSPNASSVRDVLGTLMLGILAGAKRSCTSPACAATRWPRRRRAWGASSAKTRCAARLRRCCPKPVARG